ncbi:hypothetical protein ABB37_04445 [Leptomonas pyrrhocoris]|uniref:PH-like domain-containing protein n=1 Tax=Leptomonas pyrrhocoris TaxID=157538 RepID=A0A0M9G2U7_LEPPY|nr:hypothetical protein ABB37_04445 [Leptomonas pyrrhocoris]KPA81087.1 hypothetical protein ABB37_04445 [Leptomonas pyrrhocoris]|eukprot:XP_015659526.1 hypothetical protein ABB37_04445 [Leptomonas pyrrhocoris]
MDSYVPHLHLNPSRYPARDVRAEATSRLNHTAAPLNTSDASGVGCAGAGPGRGSNNNTSMTNNTMSSDAIPDGGFAAGVAPPSPIPRFYNELNATHGDFGTANGYSSSSQGWPGQYPQRYTDPMEGRSFQPVSGSGSRGTPGPSTMRPLFASATASSPRDTNVIAGDTGRVPLWGTAPSSAPGADLEPREDFLNRYRRSYGADGLFTNAPTASSQGYEARRGGSTVFGGSFPNTNAFTSTYVGTSTGTMPRNKSTYFSSRGNGAGVSDFVWRGGTRSLATANTAPFREEERPYRVDGIDGLVNSRLRARADRWTDENTDSIDRPWRDGGDDDVTSLDAVAPPSDAVSSSSSARRHARRSRRRRGRRGHDGDDGSINNDDDEDSDDSWDGDADPLSFADAVVTAMDARPVVPLELLRKAQETPFVWMRHPSHGVLLSLLQHRGIYLPRYRELVDYHMAELFLHYLDLCREGAFFVYYAPSKWPKERFFRVRMLPVKRLEAATEPVPHLVITLHESGVHILDAIPLDNLVGVTVSPQAACFRPFLESPNTIIGCREGRGHRARMPVDGAFSLWFYDVAQHTSRSVDILTCDAKVFDIWTKTFRGLVSVNSSSVVQVAMTPQGDSAELSALAQAAQEQSEIDHGERKGKFTDD